MSIRAMIGTLLAGMLGACGADDGGAGLSQLTGNDAPSIGDAVGGDAVAADTAAGHDTATDPDTITAPDTTTVPDTVTDTVTDPDTITDPDTVTDPDTITVADTVTVTDTISDTAVTGCSHVNDCEGVVSPGPCERAACSDHSCALVPNDGVACDDGDPCNGDDSCHDTSCVPDGDPLACSDGDACTSDSCVPGVGCAFTPVTCPVPEDPCKVAKCDAMYGCGAANAPHGTACNDLNNCTIGDSCDAGVCKGGAMPCGDDDPCTTDACVAGGCVSTPIPCEDDDPCTSDSCTGGECKHEPIPGCGFQACVGKDVGAACDDADATTTADMCLLGRCRGFTATRVAATTVPGQASLAISEVDHASGAWWALYWTLDAGFQPSYAIADVTNPSAPVVAVTTTSPPRGLAAGFVGDQDGRLRTVGSGWSTSNAWDTALGASGRGGVNALWANPDRTALWALGQFGDDGWIRACRRSGDQIECDPQTLDDYSPASIPRAVAGLEEACAPDDDGPCDTRVLVAGADAPDGGYYFKDAYENVSGDQSEWSQSFIPQNPSAEYTVTATAWGEGHFLLAGTGGFMRHRRPDGTWSYNLQDLIGGISQRVFTGAWAGKGVVILSAYRYADSQVILELWTCPQGKSVETGSNWSIHTLGSALYAQSVGLFDVRGSATGELRAAGAALHPGAAVALDGLVFVRTPGSE